jgi:hypothetical protein
MEKKNAHEKFQQSVEEMHNKQTEITKDTTVANSTITKEETTTKNVVNESNTTTVYYKIQDPDGYSNLRTVPNGTVIKKVYDNERFEVIDTDDKFKKVKLADGTIGYISASRVIEIR